jgi:hypothetical protein
VRNLARCGTIHGRPESAFTIAGIRNYIFYTFIKLNSPNQTSAKPNLEKLAFAEPKSPASLKNIDVPFQKLALTGFQDSFLDTQNGAAPAPRSPRKHPSSSASFFALVHYW